MILEEKKTKLRDAIKELKEDIDTLNQNIKEFETILESINSEEDMEKADFDIEKGLKHIELF